jgi:hypothetical protein
MAGLFFCLASDTVQGFYFALLQYNPIQTFTVAFVPSMQLYRLNSKTVYRTLQGFFRRFALFQRTQYSSHTSRLYTACTTLEGIPSSAAPPPMPRYHRHAGRCTGQHSRPIIIRYIRAQRCGISQTMPARRGSPAAGARLAERNHWRLPPYPFSGFRPIANRGQQ